MAVPSIGFLSAGVNIFYVAFSLNRRTPWSSLWHRELCCPGLLRCFTWWAPIHRTGWMWEAHKIGRGQKSGHNTFQRLLFASSHQGHWTERCAWLGRQGKKGKRASCTTSLFVFSLYISIELCVLIPKLGKAGCGKFGRSAHMIVESVQPCSTSVVQCTRRDAASARWQAGVSKHSKPLLSLHPASSGLHAWDKRIKETAWDSGRFGSMRNASNLHWVRWLAWRPHQNMADRALRAPH